jgi:hypothetical protein
MPSEPAIPRRERYAEAIDTSGVADTFLVVLFDGADEFVVYKDDGRAAPCTDDCESAVGVHGR